MKKGIARINFVHESKTRNKKGCNATTLKQFACLEVLLAFQAVVCEVFGGRRELKEDFHGIDFLPIDVIAIATRRIADNLAVDRLLHTPHQWLHLA